MKLTSKCSATIRSTYGAFKQAIFCFALCFLLYTPHTLAEVQSSEQSVVQLLERIKSRYSASPASNTSDSTNSSEITSPLPQNSYPSASEQIPENVRRFPVGEELIITLKLNDIFLGDVFAIVSDKGIKVGLGEFFQLVDFAIDVEPENGVASGWFIAESSKFDARANESYLSVNIAGKAFVEPLTDIELSDDIYVELSTIASWFNLTASLDESTLTLGIQSPRPFPIEQRMARKNKSVVQGQGFSKSVLPLRENGYQMFSNPLVDFQASVRHSDSDTSGSYSILSSQDAAYLSSQVFLYGTDDDSLIEARLSLGKYSPDGDLLGPLKMSEYSFGDVVPVNAGIGATGGLSRGFSMNNLAARLADNRRTNLTGEVQVGWDIELYRNGILIDSITAIDSGRYEFNDLELGFGENNFELVFYGPQGQIERRVEQFFIDGNAVAKGQSSVQFSITESGKSVFGFNDIENNPEATGPLISAVYNYGVSDWLSLGTGASLFFPDEGQESQRFLVRSDISLGSWGVLNTQLQVDDNQSRSFLQSYRTQLAGISWDFNYQQDEILDEALLVNAQRDKSDTFNIRMNGNLFQTSSASLNYLNQWIKSDFTSGNSTEIFQNSLGLNSRYGSFSNGLIWQRNGSLDGDSGQTVYGDWLLGGTFGYRDRFGRVNTRLFTNYTIEPTSEFTSVGGTLNYPISNQFTGELRYSYNIIDSEDRYDLRLNWFGESVSVTGIASYADSDDWSVNLTMRMGLGYDATTDTLFTSGRALSSTGAVVVRMYEDENLDNQYTEGEPLLKDITVEAVQAYKAADTNSEGIAVLTSLPKGQITDIVVDDYNFIEPGMMLSQQGFAVEARQGSIQQFDIAVIRGGEVEGTLYARTESGQEDILPYVRMELVDASGNTVASTRSEFDGYYLFDKVYPGDYQIHVDTSSGRQKGLTPDRYKQVNISARGDVFTDVDFVLRPLMKANGYVASIGEFSSLGLLKIFYNLVTGRLGDGALINAFYYQLEDSDKYVLGAYYAEGNSEKEEQHVRQVCSQLSDLDLNCRAVNININY
ncbi:hypothetical protein [Alteromonas facilis]|uniref:hypothetical protein n=1 Tax=Alteromonas facilis TaxID=2048004 RepID=UPI000C289BC8|nr:hypothetical protein [Alteromonas facilis]